MMCGSSGFNNITISDVSEKQIEQIEWAIKNKTDLVPRTHSNPFLRMGRWINDMMLPPILLIEEEGEEYCSHPNVLRVYARDFELVPVPFYTRPMDRKFKRDFPLL